MGERAVENPISSTGSVVGRAVAAGSGLSARPPEALWNSVWQQRVGSGPSLWQAASRLASPSQCSNQSVCF